MTAPPRTCQGCGSRPVARKTLRFCYDCLPGGPHVPPPCKYCGSAEDYYTAGCCRWCYPGIPDLPPGSCPDCLAWGTTRRGNWLCRACAHWRVKNPVTGRCLSCGEHRHLGQGGFCRLCWRTAATYHSAHRQAGGAYQPADVLAANRHGQQLFFADMTRLAQRRRKPVPRKPRQPRAATPVPARARRKPRYKQMPLFDASPPGFTTRHGIPAPADAGRAQALDNLARELAARHGWSHTSLKRTRLGIRILLGQNPGSGPIPASALESLTSLGVHAVTLARAVLTEAGLLEDDQPPAIVRWFTSRTRHLPPAIRGELAAWFDIMRNGSAAPPRRRPRAEATTRLQLTKALPAITSWAGAGHQSLREIGRDDILAALPHSGQQRVLTAVALRSIFATLHSRKLIFGNPAARIRPGRPERPQPLPAQVSLLSEALNSGNPARAALTALFCFYALHPRQVRDLMLTDLRDRHLYIGDRSLATPGPVSDRLSRYLAYRTQRWPATINPYLFINAHTAGHAIPVGPFWIRRTLQIPPSALRIDRILDEARANPGDVRRICDLFDMTVAAALRYTIAVADPAQPVR